MLIDLRIVMPLRFYVHVTLLFYHFVLFLDCFKWLSFHKATSFGYSWVKQVAWYLTIISYTLYIVELKFD